MSGESPAPATNYEPVPNPPTPTTPEHPVAGIDTPYDPVESLGLPQPRFLGGSGAHTSSGDPEIRASYASSNATASQRASDYNGSVVGLKEGYRDDPDAEAPASPGADNIDEKNAAAAPQSSRRRKALIWGGIATVVVIVIAVVLAVVFAVVKPNKHHNASGSTSTSSGSSSGDSSGNNGTPTVNVAITGGDGSTVTMDDGTTFTYTNKLGGYWYADPNDPYKSAAKPNSWTPALNETFKYGEDKIYGVNLGGWLVLEPFICPAVFEPYVSQGVVDEYTLHQAMRKDTANGGISQLENHYATFITEQDFAAIAAAGLNYVRIPLPYWAIEVWDGEPFEPKVAWKYFLKGIEWARKYGLRINLDFHSLPGSQNGWNHSGKLGTIGVLQGPMGIANAQRSLDYIRFLAEFISQDQYKDVVTMFGVTNEPRQNTMSVLQSYYLEAYRLVRGASGIGEGNGPMISYHDSFQPRDQWASFLKGADRISLDTHPYLCFNDQQLSPPVTGHVNMPCAWGAGVNQSQAAFGLSVAGEFSNAITDCGLYVNGIGVGSRYDGTNGGDKTGSCDYWTDYKNFDATMKKGLMAFNMASMDALQNWFFWTWKVGNSSVSGKVESPQWSYSLGVTEGWITPDPRNAAGTCGNTDPWTPPLKPSQTGGAGAGTLAPGATEGLDWPPNEIASLEVAQLPTYTPTGTIPTLTATPVTWSGVTATATPVPTPGSGWTNSSDTAGAMVPIQGCKYLDPWVDPNTNPPPLCKS